MGRFRYGSNIGLSHFNCVPSINSKIKLYEKSGNVEALIDAINYILLEIRFGTNPKKRFNVTDDEDHADQQHKW